VIREKVEAAREISSRRFREAGYSDYSLRSNAHMESAELDNFCALDEDCRRIMEAVFTKTNLSARAYDRILRVARTLCDLEAVEKHITEENGVIGGTLKKHHITEAAQMRVLDRQYW
jgi:magnesium chelatase family protein